MVLTLFIFLDDLLVGTRGFWSSENSPSQIPDPAPTRLVLRCLLHAFVVLLPVEFGFPTFDGSQVSLLPLTDEDGANPYA